MPPVPVIIAVAEFIAPEAIGAVTGAIGAGVTAAVGADIASTVIAGTTVANLAGNAILTAGTNAAIAAAQGGDAAKAAFEGAVGSVVGQVAGGLAKEALGSTEYGGYSGIPTTTTSTVNPLMPATVAGSPELGSAAVGAAGRGAAGFASALAGGAPLNTALQAGLRGAEIGGLSGLASGLARYDFGTSPGEAATIGSAAGQLASYALPQVSGRSATPSYTTPVQPSLNLQGPATVAGPSATLGQSLSIAPTLGYTPTGSVFGSSDAEGKKSNVWNVGSLRNIGSAEV